MRCLAPFKQLYVGIGLSSLAALVLTSCGRNTPSSLESATQPRPLLIVMGGFSTCATTPRHGSWESPLGMEIHKKDSQLRAQILKERGITFDVILSCYTKLAELRYLTSYDDFEDLRVSVSVKDFADFLHQQIELHPRTFIVGHSYGGWLSMKTAATYGGAVQNIKSLYTLDPISRKSCLLENPVSWGNCTVAPPDIRGDDLSSIQRVTNHWANFWQNQTFYLHSSAISEADKNQKLKLGHTEIDNASEVWSQQLEEVRNVLENRDFEIAAN